MTCGRQLDTPLLFAGPALSAAPSLHRRRRVGSFVVVLLATLLLWPEITWAQAGTLTVISFNVESDDDTDPALVAADIAALAGEVDLFGLAEVSGEDHANAYRQAAEDEGAAFRYLLGTHGGVDRLAILYNLESFRFRSVRELDRFPGSRKALVGEFRHKATGIDFLFIVNHFNRRDTARRDRQARLIRDWVLAQDLPAILTGDYNFDFSPETMLGNRAFEVFTAEPGLVWVRPECLDRRNCPPNGTQCDLRFNSIMDFVFVADRGRGWIGVSDVLLHRADYCARERQGWSDHRPVLALIEIR